MLRVPGCIAAALALLAVSSLATAEEPAKVADLTGRVMVQSGVEGPATEVTPDSTFGTGDVLTCMPDSQIQVALANGSMLSIVGPAEVSLTGLGIKTTYVRLVSGLINVVRARGAPIVLETEYDVRLDVQNGSTGYAEVVPGDILRFANRSGEGVSLFLADQKERTLKAGDLPYLMDLSKLKLARKPLEPLDETARAESTGQVLPVQGEYRQGRRVIRVYPVSKVRVERMSDGGLKITGIGLGRNEFARIQVGFEAILYVAEGEYVVVDQYGNVDEFTGTAFVDRPIDRRAFDYEPVKDSADASPIRTRAR